jgi:hypothetical protein
VSGPELWTRDPLLRALRTVSLVAFLALTALVIIDPSRADNPTRAMLIGAVLLQLGYEVVIKLPQIVARRLDSGDKEDGDDAR